MIPSADQGRHVDQPGDADASQPPPRRRPGNASPSAGVALVLLIVVVAVVGVRVHSVDGDPPARPPAPTVQAPEPITIDVEVDGTVLWNGEPLASDAALDARLQQAAAQPEQPEVRLRPNKLVAHRSVARVMAAAQRIGVTKIGIVGGEQFVK